jgi:hypothetical protein
MPRKPNETPQSSFRLGAGTLADLDRIAALLAERSGVPHSRTDAIRDAARARRKNLEKSPEKTK